MKAWLMDFLKLLESAIPPGDGQHHGISYCQYGSDSAGWSDRVGLHVRMDGGAQTFFLDDADFEKPIPELVADVISQLGGVDGH